MRSCALCGLPLTSTETICKACSHAQTLQRRQPLPPDSVSGAFDFARFYDRVAEIIIPDRSPVVVECGVDCGRSLFYLRRTMDPQIRVIGITLWVTLNGGDGKRHKFWENWQRMIEQGYLDLRWPLAVLERDAIEASTMFADDSVMMVFLDDDHRWEHLYNEMKAWWPKVSSDGGILAGHDYSIPPSEDFGVKRAVDTFAEEMGVEVALGGPRTPLGDIWSICKR